MKGEFKADLVVSFAGATVRDGIGALLQSDERLVLRDHGTRQRSSEEILVFVHCASLERLEDVLGEELFLEIAHDDFGGARLIRLFGNGVHVVALSDIGDECDHFASVVFVEPGDDDGRVESTGIGKHYFCRHRFLWLCVLRAEAAHAVAQQLKQHGFLDVQAVLGFIEDHGCRAVNDLGGHF